MYIKECALGHSPRPIVDVGNGLYECPVCQAQYSTDGKSWHLRSPSLILLEDERFKLFIEERREDVQKKLSVQANRSIAEASKRIAVGIMQTGNEIGIQINNAATIIASALLVTEQIRDCRERDIDAKRRELEVFKMAFDSFGEKERLELIEGAYRIAECERSILSYKTKALAAVSKDVGIQRLKTQLQLLDKSTSKINIPRNLVAENLTILKKDLCRTIKPKKRSSLWNISSKKDHSIETEIFRVKQEYIDGELARIASNMALTQKQIDELQVTLLKEAEKGIERHEKYMKSWRDKLIRQLPAHSRALCYQFTDLFK